MDPAVPRHLGNLRIGEETERNPDLQRQVAFAHGALSKGFLIRHSHRIPLHHPNYAQNGFWEYLDRPLLGRAVLWAVSACQGTDLRRVLRHWLATRSDPLPQGNDALRFRFHEHAGHFGLGADPDGTLGLFSPGSQ